MQHALMYHGGFELNFASLKPGTRTFRGSDGADHALPEWPEEADGLHLGYMEKPGKQFFAVRVAHAKRDVILKNEVRIDQTPHMGVGKRFGAEPTLIASGPAIALIEEIIRKNPDQGAELMAIRKQIKEGS